RNRNRESVVAAKPAAGHRPAMPEKATAAPEHGAAVVAIVIEQNGNAASAAARCARGAYRFWL
ncbi:hypothetical protein SB861_64650, partial [Paraburkholderia sp. SIMBA_049]